MNNENVFTKILCPKALAISYNCDECHLLQTAVEHKSIKTITIENNLVRRVEK